MPYVLPDPVCVPPLRTRAESCGESSSLLPHSSDSEPTRATYRVRSMRSATPWRQSASRSEPGRHSLGEPRLQKDPGLPLRQAAHAYSCVYLKCSAAAPQFLQARVNPSPLDIAAVEIDGNCAYR